MTAGRRTQQGTLRRMGTSARISLTGAPGFWRYTVYLPPGCTLHPCGRSAVALLQTYVSRHVQ